MKQCRRKGLGLRISDKWQKAKYFLVVFFFFPSNMSLISGFEGESEGSSRVES